MPIELKAKNKVPLSAIFVREPMSRLVSAWRDKIENLSPNRQFYYDKFTSNILRINNPGRKIPEKAVDALELGNRLIYVVITFVQ